MKFKIGDLVRCKNGYFEEHEHWIDNTSGGAGYKPDLEFIIERKIEIHNQSGGNIIWLDNGKGIFEQALEFVNKKEIDYEIY